MVGIGKTDKKVDRGEQFATLQEMVDVAADFGAVADLRLPSMTSASIGEVFYVGCHIPHILAGRNHRHSISATATGPLSCERV